MNIFYIWFGVFYLIGMLNGVIVTVLIYKLFEFKRRKFQQKQMIIEPEPEELDNGS